MMTYTQPGATWMDKSEEQLIEQLADQRREEVTRLGDEAQIPVEEMLRRKMKEVTAQQNTLDKPSEMEILASMEMGGEPSKEKPGLYLDIDAEDYPNLTFGKIDRQAKQGGGSNPQQYGLPPGATELQDLIEHREMNFAVGNMFKACYRKGTCSHSDWKRDLEKIIWFAKRELIKLK